MLPSCVRHQEGPSDGREHRLSSTCFLKGVVDKSSYQKLVAISYFVVLRPWRRNLANSEPIRLGRSPATRSTSLRRLRADLGIFISL